MKISLQGGTLRRCRLLSFTPYSGGRSFIRQKLNKKARRNKMKRLKWFNCLLLGFFLCSVFWKKHDQALPELNVMGLSARTNSHNPTPVNANTDPVASAGTQPKASAVIGTRRAPIPPTTFPPVFMTPVAADACLPDTKIAAVQYAPSVS